MSGDLPPSSTPTRFIVSAAAFTTDRPVAVEPVKAILSTPGCAASRAPATAPGPGTTLTTPSGTPASCISCANRSVDSGASSAGFSTIVQPVASVGQMLNNCDSSGPFQGMIDPTTPIGCFSV